MKRFICKVLAVIFITLLTSPFVFAFSDAKIDSAESLRVLYRQMVPDAG